jgi:methyl halide transferase
MTGGPAGPAPVSEARFWEGRYQEGRTGWDLGGPTPIFQRLLEEPDAPPPGKILVVGCGKGHDVLSFARHGFDALGVDFAPSAVRIGTEAAGAAGLSERARFEQADIFDLPARYPAAFDYILERACYCAIDPADRQRYVQTAAALLKPGGRIIGQFFLGPQNRPGPPFATTLEEIKSFFGAEFEVERLDEPQTDGPLPGADALVILRRR